MSEPSPTSNTATPEASPFDAQHLASLDALRVFALTGVVVYHGGLLSTFPDGVNFFFVLSGFLFAWLLDREYEKTSQISLQNYYIRRCLRILPACVVSILFTLAGKAVLHNPIDWGHATSALLFNANYYNAWYDHPPTGFSHYWSLSVEEQFYLLWPILFLGLRRLGKGATLLSLMGLATLVASWRCYSYLSLEMSDAYIDNAFETRFDSLAIGCIFGLLVRYDTMKHKLAQQCRTGWEPLLPMGLLYALCFTSNRFHKCVGFTLESVAAASLILTLIQLGSHRWWRWLSHPWLASLGVLTYSGYLYHPWGLAVGWKFKMLPLAAQVGIGFVVTLLLAACSYYAIERPFMKLRHRLLSAPQRS